MDRLLPPLRLTGLRSGAPELVDLAIAIWRQRGLALIDPLALGAEETRQAVVSEANRLYGRRGVLAGEDR